MSDINIKRSPSEWVVVPFFGAASLALLAVSVMLFFSSDAFGGHYFQPKLLAIVHTLALGWGTMVIFGATYQLLPVILEQELFSSRLAKLSFICLLPGVILLVHNFWTFTMDAFTQLGGLLILTACILFSLNVMLTAKNSSRYTIQRDFIITSALWLLLTVLMGVLLVFNFSYPIFRQDHLQLLKLHAHLGLVGWFLMLIIGVGAKMLPMFLLGRSNKEKYLRAAYYLINIGLIAFLLDGFLFDLSWRAMLYGLMVVAGVVLFLLYVYDVFKNRMRKAIDYQMRHSILSFGFLILACVHVPILIFKPEILSCVLVYGVLLLLGWISSIILGMTFKTLPFIVWNSRYKQHAGKSKIPMPKVLYNDKLVKWQFFLYIPAVMSLIVGIKTGIVHLIHVSALFMVIVALFYNYNVWKIIKHKPKLP